MAIESLGRGNFSLRIVPDTPGTFEATEARLSFKLGPEGFLFIDQENAGEAVSLFQYLDVLTAGNPFTLSLLGGSIQLAALPAAPFDAFYGLSLRWETDRFTLTLSAPDPFGVSHMARFQALNLTFTEGRTPAGLEVGGNLTVKLFEDDREVGLSPQLDPDEGLIFTNTSGTVPIDSPQLDELSNMIFDEVRIRGNARSWEGIQVEFDFNQGDGTAVWDTSGVGNPLDLRIQDPATVEWLVDTHALKVETGTLIQSATPAEKIRLAAQSTDALTIEAWIRPASPTAIGPARIFSISKNTSERNVTLAQGRGRDEEGAQDIYHQRLRTTATSNNGLVALESDAGTALAELTYLVYTKDADGKACLFLNGVLHKESTVEGDFSNWDESYLLLLANELTGDRPWAGELHRICLFNRALTEEEVYQTYFPVIVARGTATLTDAPAPLDLPLPVELQFLRTSTELTLLQRPGTELQRTPEFSFSELHLSWIFMGTDPVKTDGTATVLLWDNPLEMEVAFPEEERGPHFSLAETDTIPPAHEIGETLGLQFDALSIRPLQPLAEDWEILPDGNLTLNQLPPDYGGPIPLEIPLVDERLWVSPGVPDRESLVFDFLHHLRAEEGEGVAGFEIGPVQIPPEDPDALDLDTGGAWATVDAAQFPDDLDTLLPPDSLISARLNALPDAQKNGLNDLIQADGFIPDAAPTTFFIGNWVKEDLLDWHLCMAFTRGENGVLANGFSLEGTLDKMFQDFGEETPVVKPGFLAFFAEGIFEFEEGEPAQLDGVSEISVGGENIFSGDIRLEGDTFQLNGHLHLFPDWSPVQVNTPAQVIVHPDGTLIFETEDGTFDLEGFDLRDPLIRLENGLVQVFGRWMGSPIEFSGIVRAGEFLLEGRVSFDLPFSLALGPVRDPITQVTIAEQIQICQGQLCRQSLSVEWHIELGRSGFQARLLEADFQWEDETLAVHDLSIPPFQLFSPPRTRNEMLASLVDQLKAHAAELFLPKIQFSAGFSFDGGDPENPLMGYADPGTPLGADISLEDLPVVFTADSGNLSTEGFALSQTAVGTTLTISQNGLSSDERYSRFQSFWQAVKTAEAQGELLVGTPQILRQRIAERISMRFDQVLAYHYGVNFEDNYVDLHPGMRLRIEYQNYQYVQRNSPANEGFVSSGVVYYGIHSYLRRESGNVLTHKLGFDPFLFNLDTVSQTDIDDEGASGVVDLLQSPYKKAYFRLVYPNRISHAGGSKAKEKTATLVGADTLEDLDQATANLTGGSADLAGAVSFYFRGRAAIVPEIPVYVREQVVFVSIGTTIRQLLQSYMDLPAPASGKNALAPYHGTIRPLRLLHEGPEGLPAYKPVQLHAYQAFVADPAADPAVVRDVYDLPLIKGDRFYF